MPPDLKSSLEQFVHERAMAWLDEPAPALAGKTPRTAAMDPPSAKKSNE